MKIRKAAGMLLVLGMILMTAAGALAETGRIVTPKGPANMRKRPEDKAPLVESVPNRTLVEITEYGEEWSRITYKKQSGYVKTEYLRAPSQLVGREAYPDGGAALIRSAPDEKAPVIGVLGCAEKARITGVEGEWLILERNGETGYTEGLGFSYQLQEPAGEMEWITESAKACAETALRTEPKGGGEPAGTLGKGAECAVTVIRDGECLVDTGSGYGWAEIGKLCLTAPDTWEETEGMSPQEACGIAEKKLTGKYKAFAKERLYTVCRVLPEADGYPGPLYKISFLDDRNQYRYGALVSVEKGEAVFAARYDGFAVPEAEGEELLPEGEIALTLSAEEARVGQVVELRVQAWTADAVRYDVYLDGQQIVKGENGTHFRAAFRPRQAGEYAFRVTVEDRNGKTAEAGGTLAVVSEYVVAESEEPGETRYSQRDGWWKDKKYRHSNLSKSGCAIFALAHGLHRLGITGPDTEPESLAVKYAAFLIPGEGTSNERLINKAAKDFGFKTRTALYNDEKQIVGLLEAGAVFSFSPARGHIALADGVSGKMVHVVDSAPGATLERIKGAGLYYQTRSGAFRPIARMDDLTGAKWYLETGEYGAAEYWLPLDYVAKRGVRLMQPLTAEETETP